MKRRPWSVERVVDDALNRLPGNLHMEDVAANLAHEALVGFVGHAALWQCENEDCPGRPAWETALRAAEERLTAAIEREWTAAAERLVADAVTAQLAAFPETPIAG